MLRLCKSIGMCMSLKKTLQSRAAEFLTVDAGAVLRNTPTTKQRKYKNVEITEDFKKLDENRRKQRYENMKKRQILLQQKLKNQAQLLTGPETQQIKTEMIEIEKIIKQSSKQIAELTAIIDQTQAEHMVLQGYLKIVVMNHIKYLQYLEAHEAGHVIHPETIKAIENVHYCLNHNLPVNRISLYEIMPQYFQKQIGELEESVQRLIAEKQIFIDDQDSKSSVRFFQTVEMGGYLRQADVMQLQLEHLFYNLWDHCKDLLAPHQDLLEKVKLGQTPFRDIQHLRTVLISDLPIKFLPEEQALRQDLLKVIQLKKQWVNYRKVAEEEIVKSRFSYIEPPPYIKNHPLLFERYQQIMQVYTNPIPIQNASFLPVGDPSEAILAKTMEEQIRAIVKQKYDPLFIEAMNSDRSKIDKKSLEIQFYNMSTNILENLQALQDKSKSQQQQFKALPKQKGLLAKQKKKNLISLDHLTRIIFLSNKDKNKYNLQFFAQWFGVDKEELRTVLSTVSYLRVPQQDQADQKEQSKMQIIKFQF